MYLYLGPSIKVQGCELAKIGLVHMDIQALTLIYIRPTVSSHVNQRPLLDLPHSPGIIWKYYICKQKKRIESFQLWQHQFLLVNSFQFIWYFWDLED